MIQGFNHNIRHGGRLFHVQTEDSGLTNPHIITHLYHGGTIVASKKTSYADILTSDRRDEVIREIMKEQHRQMLLDLRDGRLDAALAAFDLAPARAPADGPAAGSRRAGAGPTGGTRQGAAGRAPAGRGGPGSAGAERRGSKGPGEPGAGAEASLDDILLDYLASRTRPGEPRPKKK